MLGLEGVNVVGVGGFVSLLFSFVAEFRWQVHPAELQPIEQLLALVGVQPVEVLLGAQHGVAHTRADRAVRMLLRVSFFGFEILLRLLEIGDRTCHFILLIAEKSLRSGTEKDSTDYLLIFGRS
jgi:hypothetical protein